jgi:Fe-S-cluster-containing dehydrogenase component
MRNVTLMVFQKDCMGCHACEVACKQEHGLQPGPRLIKVIERGHSHIPVYCHHCARPPCRDACPEEAIYQNEWGIVQVNGELCIGCKECIEACPFGAMQYDEEREGALNCDLCYERLKNHEAPACSLVCPTRCIAWGDMKAIAEEIEQRLL